MTIPVKRYKTILNGLKDRIEQMRRHAVVSVNSYQILLYWEIGRTILEQQKKEGWGTKVIERLAADLRSSFPEMKGLSERNIKYMRAFAEAYPDILSEVVSSQKKNLTQKSIVQPVVAQLQKTNNQSDTFVQPLVAQIPWTHHLVILEQVKNVHERLFYIQKTIENGWSKNVLIHQIAGSLYKRQGKSITNFEKTLSPSQSELARETLKNPYLFDFIGISEKMEERELERVLIQHIKKFLLELGRGFAYVGNQYNLNVGGDDFCLDLLFYNFHLHCFVVFELKIGSFKPEYAGKMNFYINALDQEVRGKEDNPTIGVLLCKTSNETVVKYSLKNIAAAIGVSDYELAKSLPKKLKSGMPTIAELETEIEEQIKKYRKPLTKTKTSPVKQTKTNGPKKKEINIY